MLSRRQPGCRALRAACFGVGPVTSVAIWAELGDARRFASSDNVIRHTGLDVTVYPSDTKRPAGHLSRQGHQNGPGSVGYALSSILSFTGAGIAGKAVTTAVAKAAAVNSAGRALRTFNNLDRVLQKGAPALSSASLAYWDALGTYIRGSRVAALWGQATAAMSVNSLLVTGLVWAWHWAE
jgi:hypothetical protein